jgi:hypothetical protein
LQFSPQGGEARQRHHLVRGDPLLQLREHDVCVGGNPFRLCRHQMIKSKAIGRATWVSE